MSEMADFDALVAKLLETKGKPLPPSGKYELTYSQLLEGARYVRKKSHDVEYLGWQLELKKTRAGHYWIASLRLHGEHASNNVYVFISVNKKNDLIEDSKVIPTNVVVKLVLSEAMKEASLHFSKNGIVEAWNLQGRVQHTSICALTAKLSGKKQSV